MKTALFFAAASALLSTAAPLYASTIVVKDWWIGHKESDAEVVAMGSQPTSVWLCEKSEDADLLDDHPRKFSFMSGGVKYESSFHRPGMCTMLTGVTWLQVNTFSSRWDAAVTIYLHDTLVVSSPDAAK